MEKGALGGWDWKIPYRTISPRNFEAAAFRVCQILYEGHYSGVMEPMRHYIPLRKDFSNFDEVVERFRDAVAAPRERRERLQRPDRLGPLRLRAPDRRVRRGARRRRDRARAGRGPALVVRRNLRPPHPLAPRERVIDSWQNLQLNHPKAWKAAWVISRPVVVPFRAIQRAIRG